MNKDVEKIRAEIERRVQYNTLSYQKDKKPQFTKLGRIMEDEALLNFIGSLQEEPKKCMYSKDNYTDEDRKILCDGCKEECKFNKKEESVSDDLEQAIDTYLATYFGGEKEKQDWPFLKKMAIHFTNWQKQKDSIPVSEDLKEAYERYVDERMVLLRPDIADMSCDRDTKMSFDIFDGSEVEAAFYEGAKWQKVKDQETIETAIHHAYHNGKLEMKEQLMATAVDAVVKIDAGGYPYIDRTIELYDYDKDIPLAKRGDKYKVILIKED